MNNDELKKCGCDETKECGCEGHDHEHSHDHGCGCGGHDHEQDHECGCGGHDHEHNHDHECGCGCGDHNHEFESFVVDLEDEEGNVIPCEVVDGFEYKDGQYVLVQNPADGSVYLFKAVGEDGELVIPEDKEFEEVSKYYETLLEEEE